MFDSPLSASAYEVLEVDPGIDDDALRRAYRLRLRLTHPDTGGDAAVFIQVQRAWELIGTPQLRAAYDRGHGFADDDTVWDGWRAPAARTDTRPRAASYGEPGGWRRRRYLALVQEHAGGDAVADPYSPAFVRSVPRGVRRFLADALAEEDTARTVADLGMGFTAWHDVLAPFGGPAGGPSAPAPAESDEDDRLDHIVLGPTGLYGMTSGDFGGVVGFRGGEIVGPGVGPHAPVTALLTRIRAVSRSARVRFGGAVVVLPDDDLAQAVSPLGAIRGVPVVVVRRSALRTVLRSGVPGARVIGGNELFDVRTRLRQTVRFA